MRRLRPAVGELEKNVRFQSRPFGAEPTLRKADRVAVLLPQAQIVGCGPRG